MNQEDNYFDASSNENLDSIIVKDHPPKQPNLDLIEDDPGSDVEDHPFVPITSPDGYNGKSKLRLENAAIPINPDIEVLVKKKKASYRDVKYP